MISLYAVGFLLASAPVLGYRSPVIVPEAGRLPAGSGDVGDLFAEYEIRAPESKKAELAFAEQSSSGISESDSSGTIELHSDDIEAVATIDIPAHEEEGAAHDVNAVERRVEPAGPSAASLASRWPEKASLPPLVNHLLLAVEVTVLMLTAATVAADEDVKRMLRELRSVDSLLSKPLMMLA